MIFERLEDRGLAQYSYAIGSTEAGEMAVVDPRRDVDAYMDLAEAKGLRITRVLETHVHADFASGARELVERTGARLLVSGHDEGERYEVSFAHEDLRDGDEVRLGSLRLRALHTPGHTPEHLSFLLFDESRAADVPQMMLSGDFLFVGSLGRPDLLGEEAKRTLAGAMWESVRERIDDLPDGLEIHPGHGAGSMCGSGMAGRPTSTLGFERVANPFLDPSLTREAFVDRLLSTVPPFPDYYRRMKEVNSAGPTLLGGLPGREPLSLDVFRERLDAPDEAGEGPSNDGRGAVVIDLRDQLAFGGGHIPAAFGIGAGPSLSTWAAWVVPYGRPILLVPEVAPSEAETRRAVEDAVRRLVRVGLDDVRGWLEGGMEAWRGAGLPLEELPQVTPEELQRRLASGEPVEVLDVRTDEEWEAGHVEGARHVMGGHVPGRVDEVAERGGRPLAVICGSGYRSTVASSVLRRAGVEDVLNVTGGMTAWRAAGLPTST